MNNIRVAVIGIGNIGSAHAKSIANGEIKGMELTAVCDIVKERAQCFAEKYKGINVYSNYKDLFNDGKVDAVIISTPHPIHSEIAINAFQKGLHVMLEKPADISASRVLKLNKVSTESGKIFGIMFNQRVNSIYRKAKKIIQDGELGELKRTTWIITNWYRTQHYYDSGYWRATWAGEGGGVLINQAPHNLDLWQWICGMPKSVIAFCDIAKYHNIEVEDDVTILARYDNGAVGTFITSTGEYPGTNRLEIIGNLGKLVLENGKLKWWKLHEDERKICEISDDDFAHINYDYTEFNNDKDTASHKRILQNFADSILFGEELIAPGTDGIFELLISNAAYLSSWNGSVATPIDFDYEQFDIKLSKLAQILNKRCKTKSKGSIEGEYNERWKVNW